MTLNTFKVNVKQMTIYEKLKQEKDNMQNNKLQE